MSQDKKRFEQIWSFSPLALGKVIFPTQWATGCDPLYITDSLLSNVHKTNVIKRIRTCVLGSLGKK